MDMFVGAFIIIVLLTWGLVIMNIRSVVREFIKDRNVIRLYSFLTVLLIMGSLVIGVSGAVIQRAMDVEEMLKMDAATGPVRSYRH
jgi:hypothetical protein